jgi:aldose 1-epimerase
MSWRVRTETRPTEAGRDGTVYVLEGPGGYPRAEIWPANGFNCYSWQVEHAGGRFDLLYSDPQFFHGAKPTRSGVPILFPFPNRIRAGRFTWAGKEYRLPLNDPAGKNAIHGFACRRPWRVVAHDADGSAAAVTGEFRGSLDAADARDLWPADYLLRVTYRLEADRLRITAAVENPDRVPLPFGLGYHPYFRVPSAPQDRADDYRVRAAADRYWVLEDSLPTGALRPVDAARDLRTPRPVAELSLDDVLHCPAPRGDPAYRGSVFRAPGAELVRLETSASFGELVVFTPPHRQAVCLEPYTCTTDAINLQAQGVDAGWRALEPGGRWTGGVGLTFPPLAAAERLPERALHS